MGLAVARHTARPRRLPSPLACSTTACAIFATSGRSSSGKVIVPCHMNSLLIRGKAAGSALTLVPSHAAPWRCFAHPLLPQVGRMASYDAGWPITAAREWA